MTKRKRQESSSPKRNKVVEWDDLKNLIGQEVDLPFNVNIEEIFNDNVAICKLGETSCNVFKIKDKYYELMQFFYHNADSSLLKVYHLSKPRDGTMFVVTERYVSTLDKWMSEHSPMEHGEMNTKEFLFPFRSLLENIISLMEKYEDFYLEESRIFVINAKDGVRFKVGLTKQHKRSHDDLIHCTNDAAKIVENWFSKHGMNIQELNDLILLIHCLKTLHRFPHTGRLNILLKHPVFYVGKEKAVLFDMVIKVQHLLGTAKSGAVNRDMFHGTKDLLDGFGLLGLQINGATEWYDHGYSNAAIYFCLKAKPSYNTSMNGFIKTLRNLGTHLHEHFQGTNNMEDCVVSLDRMMPGCWSVIHYVLMKSNLAKHFTTDRDFY